MDVWLAAAERQRTHGDLVNLSAGQPSAGAPAPVRAAAAAAALDTTGSATRWRWAFRSCARRSPAPIRPGTASSCAADDVVITTGSSGGFLLAFLACFDVGDRVAVTSPGYPCYRNILSALGCEVVELPCGPETRFQPTVEMLAALDPPVRGVVVASPANPTGTVIPPGRAGRHRVVVRAPGVQLVSDEVYHGLVYPGRTADQLCVGDVAGSRCGEQLLEVLRDDGLAPGLAAGAAGAASRGRPPDRQLHDLPARAGPVRRGGRVHAGVDRRGRGAVSTITRSTASCCCTGCARSASTGSRRPTARSTSMPTSRTTPRDSLPFC